MEAIAGHLPRLSVTRRDVIARGTLAVGGLATTRSALAADPDIIVVSKNDTGIMAVGSALEQAAWRTGPVTIAIRPGVYREKLHVTVPDVTLVATGPGVVLTYAAAAGLARPDGGKWGTGGSATLTVEAPGVTLRGLTIRNDFDYLADTLTHASGGAQAVALSIARGADRTAVEDCAIEGYQDTLYVSSRARFRRCRIAGGVDFIFGGAAALFQDCTIVTRHVPGAIEQGFIAAPSTLAAQRFGLVFNGCNVTREAGVPDGSTWLGRPWRAGGNMAILGAAAFLRCRLDGHIKREGWTAMGFTDPAGIRRMLEPTEARLFEWKSTGPGAGDPLPGRRRLTDAEAAAFTQGAILQGWVP
ncbi:MAG: pectinesterase family protein [Sphingomonas taxi]